MVKSIPITGYVQYRKRMEEKYVLVIIRRKDMKNWGASSVGSVFIGLGMETDAHTCWIGPSQGEVWLRRDLDAAETEAKKETEETD